MDNREAIEALRDLLDTTREYPHLDGMTMFGDAIDLAISALEKQKPVKVDSEWDRYYGKNNPCCGACGAYVDEYSKYCKRCGRPIDWRD